MTPETTTHDVRPSGDAPQTQPERSQAKTALFRILAIVIGIAVAELLLHLLTWISPTIHGAIVPHNNHVWSPELGFRLPNPRFYDHDEWGFHNTAVPDQAHIVTLGDSHTYGYNSRAFQTWPAVLGESLGATVYNLGFCNCSPANSLFLWDKVVGLKPKTVIVGLYTGNDFRDALLLFEDQHTDPVQRVHSLLGDPNDPNRYSDLVAEVNRMVAADRTPTPRQDSRGKVLGKWCLTHIRLAGLVDRIVKYLRRNEEKWSWDQLAEDARANHTPDQRWPFEWNGHRTILTPQHRMAALNPEYPRIQAGKHVLLASMLALAERTEALGADMVVLLIPTKDLAFADLVAQSGLTPPPSYKRLLKVEGAALAELQEFFAAHHIRTIDALPIMRKALAESDEPVYRIYQGGHPTSVGDRLIGQAVAEILRSERPSTP